jgi:superfamily II RNA helicase
MITSIKDKRLLFCILGSSNTFKIVKMIMERKFQPVIVFSFSKKECEAYALQMSKLDFNTGVNLLFGIYSNNVVL